MKAEQRGFTLVELLVVIAIIGILMGLLLPAVSAVRERSRSMQCSNRIRQLALGALQYEVSKKEMPGYLYYFGLFPADGAATGSDPSDPGNYGGSVPLHCKIGGYGIALLPFLDNQSTYEHWTEDRYPIIADGSGEHRPTGQESGTGFHGLAAPNLPSFQCPSNPNRYGSHGRNSYVPNNGMCHLRSDGSGGFLSVHSFSGAQDRANGVMNAKYVGDSPPGGVSVGPEVRLDDIKDGKANTILFGENVQAYPWFRPGFLSRPGVIPADPSIPIIPYSTTLTFSKFTNGMVWHYEDRQSGSMPNSPTGEPCLPVNDVHKINGGGRTGPSSIFTRTMTPADCYDLARPSSAHVDGFNAAFADGQTRYVADSVDYRVFQAIMTPRGKSSDVPFDEFVLTDEIDP